MSKEVKFIPLSELGDYSDSQLAWRVNLPEYVPKERIGINVDKIKLLSHLAGLSSLRVDSKSGEESFEEIVPGAIDSQGTATAGITVTKAKVQLVNTKIENDRTKRRGFYSEYFWNNGHITINSSELNKKTLEAARKDNGPSLRDPEEWSNLLNKSLKQGITSNAKEQLIDNVTFYSKYWATLALITSLVWDSFDFNLRSIAINALATSTYNQGLPTWLNAMHGIPASERRLSLIPAYQVDRLFAVHAIAKTSRLVKVLK